MFPTQERVLLMIWLKIPEPNLKVFLPLSDCIINNNKKTNWPPPPQRPSGAEHDEKLLLQPKQGPYMELESCFLSLLSLSWFLPTSATRSYETRTIFPS